MHFSVLLHEQPNYTVHVCTCSYSVVHVMMTVLVLDVGRGLMCNRVGRVGTPCDTTEEKPEGEEPQP